MENKPSPTSCIRLLELFNQPVPAAEILTSDYSDAAHVCLARGLLHELILSNDDMRAIVLGADYNEASRRLYWGSVWAGMRASGTTYLHITDHGKTVLADYRLREECGRSGCA